MSLRICSTRHASRAVEHVAYRGVTLAVARARMAAGNLLRAQGLQQRATVLGAARLQALLDAVGELPAVDPVAVFAAVGRLPLAVMHSRAAGPRYLATVVRRMVIGTDQHESRKTAKDAHQLGSGPIQCRNDAVLMDPGVSPARGPLIPIEWDLVAQQAFEQDAPRYATWRAKMAAVIERGGRSSLEGHGYLGRYPGEEEFLLPAIAGINAQDHRLRVGTAAVEEMLAAHADRLIHEVRPVFLEAARRARGTWGASGADPAARRARGTWSGSETPTPGAAEPLIRGASGADPAARMAGVPAADIGSPVFQRQLHAVIAGIDIASPYRTRALGFAAQWQAGSGAGQQGTGGEATVSPAVWTDLVAAVAQLLECDPVILAPVLEGVTARVLTLWAANVRGEPIDGDLWGQVPRQHQSAEPLRRPLHLLLALLNDTGLTEAERALVGRAVVGALADPKQMVSVMALLDDVARLRLPRERFLRILIEAEVYRERFGALVAGADLYIPLRTQDRDHGKKGYGAKIELAFITATALRGESIATIPTDPRLRRRRCDYLVDGTTYVELKSLAEGDMILLADQIDARVEDALDQMLQTAADLPGGGAMQRRVVVILPAEREPLLDAAMAVGRPLTRSDSEARVLRDALQDALAQCQQSGAELSIALMVFERGVAVIRELRPVAAVVGLPAQMQAVFGGAQQRAGVSALFAQLTTAIYRRYGNRPRIAASH